MKRTFFLILLLVCGTIAMGQSTFMKRYGTQFSDSGNQVIETRDGNFLIVGLTYGFGSGGNAFLIKVDQQGTVIWARDFAGINGDDINDVIELSDGSLVFVGGTSSYGAGMIDALIMKTDSLGNLIWAKTFGDWWNDRFYIIKPDGANGFYVIGTSTPPQAGNHAIVCRLDASGNMIWSKADPGWSGFAADLGIDILPLSSGNLAFADFCCGPLTIQLTVMDPAGNLLWSNGYTPSPGGSGLWGLRMIEAPSGDLLVNYAYSNSNTVAQSLDNSILRLDSLGNVIWNKSFGGTYQDYPFDMLNTSDGNIMLSGFSNSAGNGETDASLMKLSHSGNVIWAKNYGLAWSENVFDCIQTSDGGYMLTGQQWSMGYDPDSAKVFALKTDSLGGSACNEVAWTPTVSNQNTVAATPSSLNAFTLPESDTVSWSPNNRYFYTYDNCFVLEVDPDGFPDPSMDVYPNPFLDDLSIAVSEAFEPRHLFIFDLFGRVVWEGPFETKPDLQELDAGTYFLKVTDGQGITLTKQLLKM